MELPGALKVIRRPLIRLVCSHAKNWGASSVRALCFMMNPLLVVMKGFMVATMNPFSWDVVLRSALADQRRGQVPADGARGSLTLHDANHEPRTQGFLLSTPLFRRPAQSSALQMGGCDH